MKRENQKNLGSSITRSIFIRFFVTLALFVAAVALIFITTGAVLRLFVWQPYDPTYQFLSMIGNNAGLVIATFGLIGFCVIFYIYWRRTLGFIDTIVKASETLIEKGEILIELPEELAQVEYRMNQAKQEMLKNSQLAKEAERRKNEMVMYLAHDIKTPLTSVIGYLSLLDEAPDMPPEQKTKYVNITLEKAYRLEKLVDEFFEITRYNFLTGILSKEKIDLYYMLVQMTDEFYPLLEASGKQLTLHVPEDMTIYGNADQLARVFNNVLKNAVSYSPDNGSISITAAMTGSVASIVFTNQGNIPQDKLATIFDKFYRLDSARSSNTGGAGLGLAIAKEIILSHGGRIYADSDAAQTSFTIEIPAEP